MDEKKIQANLEKTERYSASYWEYWHKQKQFSLPSLRPKNLTRSKQTINQDE